MLGPETCYVILFHLFFLFFIYDKLSLFHTMVNPLYFRIFLEPFFPILTWFTLAEMYAN